jgi:tetratricopeptide (TPR) repeat protein
MKIPYREENRGCQHKNTSTVFLKSIPNHHSGSSWIYGNHFMLNSLNISDSKKKLIIYIILTAATFIVYWQVHHFGFVNFDDNIYITENSHIQSGITPKGICWAFTTRYFELWNPLVWLSFMLDYQFYGLNAGGYHVTNLILHILSTLLLFWLFNRMTKALWKSAFIAAFFALHPLHVESVAWIAERKDVLSAFFWILTLCLYVYYTEKPAIKRYLFILLTFSLALLSKPMVVTLPIIMILLDYWPLKRFETQKGNAFLWQVKEKLPLFVMSLVLVIITLLSPEKTTEKHFSLISRLMNAPISFVIYLKKTFWPLDLSVFYPFLEQIPVWQVLGAIFLITIVSVSTVALAKRLPYLLVGWFWYVITIIPVIGIIQINLQAMADRYTYLPLIGISIILAWGIPPLFREKNIRNKILFPMAIAFILSMSLSAWKQCGYWKNAIELYKYILHTTQNNYAAHVNLGSALFDERRTEEAISHYNEAIRIMPNLVLSYDKRGIALAKVGRYQQAIKDFNEAIRLSPDYDNAYYNRGTLYQGLGRYQLAISDLSETIRLKPDHLAAYFNRGSAYISLGRYQQALEDLSKVISLNSASFDAYNNRGCIYLTLGRHQQALEDYSKAISLKPDYADAWNNRAFVYLNRREIASGCGDAQRACELGNCTALQAARKGDLCR